MEAAGLRSRTIAALGIAVALLSACNSQADDDFYSFMPDRERMHPPVSDANAPTISELEAQGFKRTFWDLITTPAPPIAMQSITTPSI